MDRADACQRLLLGHDRRHRAIRPRFAGGTFDAIGIGDAVRASGSRRAIKHMAAAAMMRQRSMSQPCARRKRAPRVDFEPGRMTILHHPEWLRRTHHHEIDTGLEPTDRGRRNWRSATAPETRSCTGRACAPRRARARLRPEARQRDRTTAARRSRQPVRLRSGGSRRRTASDRRGTC